MPIDFPHMDSLVNTANVWKFRHPNPSEVDLDQIQKFFPEIGYGIEYIFNNFNLEGIDLNKRNGKTITIKRRDGK